MQLNVREYTMQSKKHTSKLAVGSSLLIVSTMSYAVDVTTVTTALSEAATTVGTVCAAALGVVVVVKVFKYIRSAL
jgi:cytochrome c oxidase subunit IV